MGIRLVLDLVADKNVLLFAADGCLPDGVETSRRVEEEWWGVTTLGLREIDRETVQLWVDATAESLRMMSAIGSWTTTSCWISTRSGDDGVD